jgi:glucose-6-phosphate 1-dehydrogenase
MMSLSSQHEPTVIVIFGASGDLAQRKVVPALYNLFLDHWLPERFALIGFARTSFTETSFREHLRTSARRGGSVLPPQQNKGG